ncbi:lysophospholipid acyltransferase family protein [candidate division KSB1 bacterium]|nr:lysophospholipid acyltransferase family protein [candidate division KSB1 bacterium]
MKNWLYKRLYSLLAWVFIHGISSSLRIHVIGGKEVDELFKKGERLIFSFWHGRHFLVINFLRRMNANVIVSPSRDGMLIADVLKKSGFGIVAGSSDKSPARALIKAVRRVQEGSNLLVTPDGPKGPIYQVKPGAVFVAKKSGAWVIPMSISAKPALTMRSWDKYQIPLPFAKTLVIYGKPYQLDEDTSQATIDKECERLGIILIDLTRQADERIGLLK